MQRWCIDGKREIGKYVDVAQAVNPFCFCGHSWLQHKRKVYLAIANRTVCFKDQVAIIKEIKSEVLQRFFQAFLFRL
jgi:hypothetical protein